MHTQREMATLLVHTQTSSIILPLGSYFSIRLQQWLNTCLVKLKLRLPPESQPSAQTVIVWRITKQFRIQSHLARVIQYIYNLMYSAAADAI